MEDQPKTRRVLVVDDEKNIRLTLRQVLEDEGLDVETATDGAEGLEKARAQQPAGGFDLVLMDLRMPGMGGMEALPRLRELDADVPVVVFTAHGNADNATEAMKLGATDFAEKPFSPQQIRALVRGLEADRSQRALATDAAGGENAGDKQTPPRHVHRTLVVLEDPATAEALLSLALASANSYEHSQVVALMRGTAAARKEETPPSQGEGVAQLVRRMTEGLGIEVHAARTPPEDGGLREALLSAVREEGPEHVLLEWSGSPAEARQIDALAQEVASEVSCEVTLVRPGGNGPATTQSSGPPRRIAAAVSRRAHALAAVRRALELARGAGVASLTLLSAQTVPPEGDEERLDRDGRALIRQVARKAGLAEHQYRTHVSISNDSDARALVRALEDFDTVCISAAYADDLVPVLFDEYAEGGGRIRGTVALVRGPEHEEPTILESLVSRLTGGA